MYKNKTISLCLPCRNEAKNIPRILGNIPEYIDEIIVVSNCSTDDSIDVARKHGVVVIEDNRTQNGIGYGFAHQTAIEAATGDIVVGVDCDGTYPVEALTDIIDHMLADKIDFVSCSRYPLQEGTRIPLKLRVGVKLLNLEVRLLYGLKVKDILSGMWVFRKEAKPSVNQMAGDWNFSPQVKINAAKNTSLSFKEFPILQRARLGHSHQAYFKTGLRHAIWLLTNKLSGILRKDEAALNTSTVQEAASFE
jgi:glycosyltransferase involved in cell wall biosynthesis